MGNWKIGTLGLASLVAFTSLAAADTPATAEKAAAPSANDVFAKLPSGKLEMPKSITMPKSIGATEKVEGFFVELPPYHSKGMHGPSYATVHASSDAAQGFRSGNRPDDPTAPCFMSAYPSYSSDVNWSSNLATTTNIQNYSNASYPGAPNYGSVNLVRSDRVLKEEKDKLTYEVKVVFADAETMGVRQHSKQTLDFTLLRELPGKVKVWGAKSDGEAIFLVRREKHDLGQPGHGHDLAGERDDEARARGEARLAHGDREARGRRPARGSSVSESCVLAMHTGSSPPPSATDASRSFWRGGEDHVRRRRTPWATLRTFSCAADRRART
jgi:hypothetical protein